MIKGKWGSRKIVSLGENEGRCEDGENEGRCEDGEKNKDMRMRKR